MKVESALAVLRVDDAFYEITQKTVNLVCLVTVGTLCPQMSGEVSTCEHTKPVLLLG